MLFICYPGCSTCKKARAFLQDANAVFTERNIKTEPPTESELSGWIAASGLPVKKWFNTSGLVYKSQNLKEKLPDMPVAEQIALLASDGMLVKRPILVLKTGVLIGFQADGWRAALTGEKCI